MSRRLLGRVGFLALLMGPWAAGPASGEWVEVRKILGADTAANDMFGYALALDGDRLAVGALRDDSPPLADAGSVYLFERNKGGPERWGQVAKLTASEAAIVAARDSNSSASRARVPHSAGELAPAGGGTYLPTVLNNWPTKPSGVQFARPIFPPLRQTRSSSFAARCWSGVNITPKVETTTSKLWSGNGSASASASRKPISSRSAAARSRARAAGWRR